MMIARVITIQGSPDRIDEGIRYFEDQIVPTIEGMDGFQGVYLLIDRATGKTVRITLWETEEAQRASGLAVERLRAQDAERIRDWRDPFPGEPVVEVYEVAVRR
jgi:heme-degrading monooxygenase HmoA